MIDYILNNRKSKVTAIICEMNPPHIGHARLIENAKKFGGTIALIMSGNFVQRGTPAVFDKLARARAAMAIGADIVLELPAAFSLLSAEGFARSGVLLANAIGADTLCFGAENASVELLEKIAEVSVSPEAEELTAVKLGLGLSYAKARAQAISAVFPDAEAPLSSPNNLLAIEYIRAIARENFDIRPVAFSRTENVSSEEIRKLLLSGTELTQLQSVPRTAAAALEGCEPVFLPGLDVAVLSRLRQMQKSKLLSIRGAGDGIGERVYNASREAYSLVTLADTVKDKRHTHSGIRRFILAAALEITENIPESPEYIRPLASNPRGRELLAELRNGRLPVLTKPAKVTDLSLSAQFIMRIESAATDLYNLGLSKPEWRLGGQEWKTTPIVD
ncbi:MAG: nucleotidyltransferase family protein [Oscillospiraceae bacterium]|nr:nucleotidyltransferase family protein [Oscillospiraceae bacterium]